MCLQNKVSALREQGQCAYRIRSVRLQNKVNALREQGQCAYRIRPVRVQYMVYDTAVPSCLIAFRLLALPHRRGPCDRRH